MTDLPADLNLSPERVSALAALEGEFSAMFGRFRAVISENAHRLSPGMLPGTYKAFTTIVGAGSISPSALALALQVDKGMISRAIRELEALDLIRRVPDPNDGRSSVLSPTEEGTARLVEARRPHASLLARSLSSWSPQEIAHLSDLLHSVNNGLAPERCEPGAH